MDALILSCSTGGGHNAAAFAVKEELAARGHHAVLLDPYTLKSRKLAAVIGRIYVRLVQKLPKLFGLVYSLGDGYRRLPFRSPVYFANKSVASCLQQYLREHPTDVIVTTHLFPAEMITYLKLHGVQMPKTVFIATDYTCIPFTEETLCDCYVIGHASLRDEFAGRGIPREKILALGIPVRRVFEGSRDGMRRADARKKLGLSEEKRYILVAGGSIGAGGVARVVRALRFCLRGQPAAEAIILCGKNKKLYRDVKRLERRGEKFHAVWYTSEMELYLSACDVYLTKPGGLSSTEAAVAGIPILHIDPIPGCETHNRDFFVRQGLSLSVGDSRRELLSALQRAENPKTAAAMRRAQERVLPRHACGNLCRWLEETSVHG